LRRARYRQSNKKNRQNLQRQEHGSPLRCHISRFDGLRQAYFRQSQVSDGRIDNQPVVSRMGREIHYVTARAGTLAPQ
jgi:hypothetical protein